MPLMMSADVPAPVLSSTRTGRILAEGAVPATPMPLLVDAAAMPATCVPWPFRSCAPGVQVSSATMSTPGRSFSFRSGWFRSTPVSTIAIVVPAPSAPRFQAPAALICDRPHWRPSRGSFGATPVGAPPVSYDVATGEHGAAACDAVGNAKAATTAAATIDVMPRLRILAPPTNGVDARFLSALSLGGGALPGRLAPAATRVLCALALDLALQVLERVVDVVAHHRSRELVGEPAEQPAGRVVAQAEHHARAV